jgi:DNA-binding transcriptional LysR family regulator
MLQAVTLDQLRILIAIADSGSFSAAARQVGRAQSAISHAVAMLEQGLALQLFDRSSKRPSLTQAGHAILDDARVIVARADRLKARARSIESGVEPELTVAVSVVMPRSVLVRALDTFRHAFATTRIRLFVEEVGGAPQLVNDGRADLGFVGQPSLQSSPVDGGERIAIGTVEIVTVCAPDHPLAQRREALNESDLFDMRQLVPTSRALPRYLNRLTQDVWEVADLNVRHAMLLAGIGWGTAPRHLVEDDLRHGRLIEIDVAARSGDVMRVPLLAIYRADHQPGPAARWLIDEMRRLLAVQ